MGVSNFKSLSRCICLTSCARLFWPPSDLNLNWKPTTRDITWHCTSIPLFLYSTYKHLENWSMYLELLQHSSFFQQDTAWHKGNILKLGWNNDSKLPENEQMNKGVLRFGGSIDSIQGIWGNNNGSTRTNINNSASLPLQHSRQNSMSHLGSAFNIDLD